MIFRTIFFHHLRVTSEVIFGTNYSFYIAVFLKSNPALIEKAKIILLFFRFIRFFNSRCTVANWRY